MGSRISGITGDRSVTAGLPRGDLVGTSWVGSSASANSRGSNDNKQIETQKPNSKYRSNFSLRCQFPIARHFGYVFGTGSGSVPNVYKPSAGSSIAVYGVGAVGLTAIVVAAYFSNAFEHSKGGRFPIEELVKGYSYSELHKAIEDIKGGLVVVPGIMWD